MSIRETLCVHKGKVMTALCVHNFITVPLIFDLGLKRQLFPRVSNGVYLIVGRGGRGGRGNLVSY